MTIALLSTASPALAATFTVEQGGTGDYTTIQACADAAQAGDTCLVSGGTNSGDVSPAHNGSAGMWITFQAAPGEAPVVTGQWDLEGSHFIVVEGFEVGGRSFSSVFSEQPCGNIQNMEGPNIERPNIERPNMERPNMERPNMERPNMERPNMERTGG